MLWKGFESKYTKEELIILIQLRIANGYQLKVWGRVPPRPLFGELRIVQFRLGYDTVLFN